VAHLWGRRDSRRSRIVVTEAEAAAFLKDRSTRHSVEVVEVYNDDEAMEASS
jgi:hypothetical protein